MPNELIQYSITFKNQKNDDVFITIQDFKNVTDMSTVTVIQVKLQPGSNPFTVQAYNTSGRIYGIFGKRGVFSFKSTQQYNMNTFSGGEDGRFFVTAVLNSGDPVIIKGFVVMDDNEEKYVPPGDDVYISFTCGLANLQGVPLTDFDGQRIDPDIPLSRIKLMAYALYKTGIGCDIVIVDNLFEGQMLYRSTDADIVNNPWDQSWQFPLTYEKEIEVLESCYTVIEKLLGKHFRLCFRNDAWWIVRVSELKFGSVSYTRFNAGGAVISGVMDENIISEIGHRQNHDVYFVNRQSKVTNRRPSKSVQVQYNYEVPDDIPRNKAFIRGELNLPLSGVDFTAYDPSDWTIGKDSAGTPADVIIKKFFTDGYEVSRYLQFSATPSTLPDTTLTSKKIYMVVGDKFKFGIDRKLSADLSGGGTYRDTIAKIRLYGTDGTFYTLHGGISVDPQIRWEPCTAAFNTNQKLIQQEGENASDDLSEWKNRNLTSAPLPVSGYIQIQLYQSANGGDTRETRFANLDFEYIPLRNGSYKKYTGERVTITRQGNYSNPKEDQVHLNTSASTKFLDKGSLLKYDSGSGLITLLSDHWFDWAMYHAGAPYDTIYNEIEKRLKRVALDHFNQYHNDQKEFFNNLKGLVDDEGKLCDMINVYRNTVNSENNNGKLFVLLDMNQNFKTCEWSGSSIEIDDEDEKFAAADVFDTEFKYLEN